MKCVGDCPLSVRSLSDNGLYLRFGKVNCLIVRCLEKWYDCGIVLSNPDQPFCILRTGSQNQFTKQLAAILMKYYNLPITLFVFAISFWVAAVPVVAQESTDYARLDSSQAYWKLKADFSDQKPVVQFYNDHHELLYQERLPGDSRRITRRTVRAFDVLLANLTTQKILATTYLTNNSLMESVSPAPIPASEKSLAQHILDDGLAVFSINPSVNQAGKLTINFAQFTPKQVAIVLEDEDQTTIFYDDFTNLPAYQRTIDLGQLLGGTYLLSVKSNRGSFLYRVTIDRILNRYYLQAR